MKHFIIHFTSTEAKTNTMMIHRLLLHFDFKGRCTLLRLQAICGTHYSPTVYDELFLTPQMDIIASTLINVQFFQCLDTEKLKNSIFCF